MRDEQAPWLALALALALTGVPRPAASQASDAEARRDSAVLVLPPVSSGPPGTGDLAERALDLVRAELVDRGHRLVADEVLARLRDGTTLVEGPDLSAAHADLRRGKDLYLDFGFAEAAGHLERAADAFDEALPHSGDLDSLIDALTFLGTAAGELGREADAREAFLRILILSPAHTLDEAVHPPEVVSAFEAVRAEAAARPTGRLAVASAPPLADVFLNGQRIGRTPLSASDIPVGRHALRVDADDHRPWAAHVTVAEEGAAVEVRLEPSAAGDELEALEYELSGGGRLAEASAAAARLTRGTGAGAVGALALAQLEDGYLMAFVLIDNEGDRRLVWTVVDQDFLRAQAAARLLVETLAQADSPRFVGVDLPEPRLDLDHARWLFGFSPASPPFSPGDDRATPRAGRRPWLWAGLAVGVVAAAAGAYAIGSGSAVEAPSYRVGVEAEVIR